MSRGYRKKEKKRPFLIRLFPHRPILRILFVISMAISSVIVGENMYRFYQIYSRETALVRERDRLAAENASLARQKEELSDPAVIERRAREELGMVRQGEVPYVK